MFTIDHMMRMAKKHHFFFNDIHLIHVAGTNGKGSTSTILYNILSTSYQTGIYTSPYDQQRFDNIKINDKVISTKEVIDILNHYEADFIHFGLSEFEIDTWVALAWFHQMNCTYAVIEVGLGGIDDATNVISPKLSLITNIGMDHMDVLGNSIEDIARAKAGIIKPHTPCVIGYHIESPAREVIKGIAENQHAPLITATPLSFTPQRDGFTVTFQNKVYDFLTPATYQIHNLALALTAITQLNLEQSVVTPTMIQEGLKKDLLPKRFQIISNEPLIILDGAHNLEGIQALISSIRSRYRDQKITIFMGVLKDKPYQAMLESLQTVASKVYLIHFDHERALDPESLRQKNHLEMLNVSQIKDVILNRHDIYLLTGSLYFLRETKTMLKEIICEKKP